MRRIFSLLALLLAISATGCVGPGYGPIGGPGFNSYGSCVDTSGFGTNYYPVRPMQRVRLRMYLWELRRLRAVYPVLSGAMTCSGSCDPSLSCAPCGFDSFCGSPLMGDCGCGSPMTMSGPSCSAPSFQGTMMAPSCGAPSGAMYGSTGGEMYGTPTYSPPTTYGGSGADYPVPSPTVAPNPMETTHYLQPPAPYAPQMASLPMSTQSIPSMQQMPAMQPAPSMQQMPYMTQSPAMQQMPMMQQAPVMTQAPLMQQAPAMTQAPLLQPPPAFAPQTSPRPLPTGPALPAPAIQQSNFNTTTAF